jgi:hypothetical protein
MQLKLSGHVQEIAIPKFATQPEADRLLFSPRTGKIIRLNRRYLDRLSAGEFTSLPDRLFMLLWDNEFLVPADEDESTTVLTRMQLEKEDERSLNTTLLIPPINHSILQEIVAKVSGRDTLGFSHHIRFILPLKDPADAGWITDLDSWLTAAGKGKKLRCSLTVLYQGNTPEKIRMPEMRTLMWGRTIFVNREGDRLMVFLRGILQFQREHGRPKMDTRAVVECAGDWSKPRMEILTGDLLALSEDPGVTIEFVTDEDTCREHRAAFIKYLMEKGIRCKWMPGSYRLRSCAIAPGMLTTGAAHDLLSLENDPSWDGEDILGLLDRFPRHASPLDVPLYRDRLPDDLSGRVLATAGILPIV